jgi:phospholipid transport system substrate-binding protein
MSGLVLRYTFCTGVVALLMALMPVKAFAAAESNDPVVQFVQGLGNQALTSLTAKGLPYNERSQRVRTLLLQYFDIQTIGRFVLGTSWSQATDAQRQEYFKLFEDMIVRTYTHRFEEYSGQSFTVKGTQADKGEQDSIVSTVIAQPDGPPVHVDWRVRNEGGTLKIVDVLIENVSMSITQRADFASIIQNGGGKVDALLAALKNRTQQ